MDFYLIIDNLFIQEGVYALLSKKYASSTITRLNTIQDTKDIYISENSIFIFNHPDIIYTYRSIVQSLIIKKQIKTILIANSKHLEDIKNKDFGIIDALMHSNCSLDDMNEALSHVIAGVKYRCKKLNELIATNTDLETHFSTKEITNREIEIIKLLLEGKTSQHIAEKLNISYFTVTTHRRNINKKLDLKSSQDLVLYMMKNNFSF